MCCRSLGDCTVGRVHVGNRCLMFEQEFKDVCAKVHAYVAPPVYTHLQASVDSGRKG
jgi:hypothetical protein